MSNEKEKNYYIKKKRILMRQFNVALTIVKDILIDQFGETKFNELSVEMRKDFESLIPQIPYVGGKENLSTQYLVASVLLMPLFRVFEREGLTFDEIGELSYTLFEAFYKVIPHTNDIFSEEFLNKRRKMAKNSKLRKYPGGWVFDFVEGDGKTFTYGTDYSECGIHKFYKSQGLEHLMPLLCISDFAMARAYGYGLKRTQTLAQGATSCDIRFIKGGNTPRGWPPENLPEFKEK